MPTHDAGNGNDSAVDANYTSGDSGALRPMPVPEPVDSLRPQRHETVHPSKLTLSNVEGILRSLGQDENTSFVVRTNYRKNRFQEFNIPQDVHRLLEPENIEGISSSPTFSDGSRLNLRIGKYGIQFATEVPENGATQLSDQAIDNALLYLQKEGIGSTSRLAGAAGAVATPIIGILSAVLLAAQLDSWFNPPGNSEIFLALLLLAYPIGAIYLKFFDQALAINEKWLDTTVPNGATERVRKIRWGRVSLGLTLLTPYVLLLLEQLLNKS